MPPLVDKIAPKGSKVVHKHQLLNVPGCWSLDQCRLPRRSLLLHLCGRNEEVRGDGEDQGCKADPHCWRARAGNQLGRGLIERRVDVELMQVGLVLFGDVGHGHSHGGGEVRSDA